MPTRSTMPNAKLRTCLLVMRLCGLSANDAQIHVTQLRNIVDLNSRAPSNQHHVNRARPSDFLEQVSDQVINCKNGMVGQFGEIVMSSNYLNAASLNVSFFFK